MGALPHHHLGQVDSTLTRAWQLAAEGAIVPFWLTADEQLAGRGRGQRAWHSRPGNLYSTRVGPSPAPGSLGLLPFAVALAVRDTLALHLPDDAAGDLRLKWPNDVLCDGAKMAGILIEQRRMKRAGEGARDLVAIGIGINVEHAPTIEGRKTSCLAALGSPAVPGAVFETLSHRIEVHLDALIATPATIVPAWTRHAVGLGQPVTVDLGGQTCHGTFDHLAADGALMLRQSSGAIRAIRAGDVFLSGT